VNQKRRNERPGRNVRPVHRPIEGVPGSRLAQDQLREERHSEGPIDTRASHARPVQDDQQPRCEACGADEREIAVRAGSGIAALRNDRQRDGGLAALHRERERGSGGSAPRRVGCGQNALRPLAEDAEENVAREQARVVRRAERIDDERRDACGRLHPFDTHVGLALRYASSERQDRESGEQDRHRTDDDEASAMSTAIHV
jgi:hypothetical protein